MRTSAAGNSAVPGRSTSTGFTLVELLVTLVVASLLVGLAALALPRGENRALGLEADRLAALLDTARARAAAENRPIAWAPTPDGYLFLTPSPRGWTPLSSDPLIPRRWEWMRGAPAPRAAPARSSPAVSAGDVVVSASGGAPGAPAGWLLFGSEPVGPPMRVNLAAPAGAITLSSDGLAPFVQQGQP